MTEELGFVMTLTKAKKDAAVTDPVPIHLRLFVAEWGRVDALNRRVIDDRLNLGSPTQDYADNIYVQLVQGWSAGLGA